MRGSFILVGHFSLGVVENLGLGFGGFWLIFLFGFFEVFSETIAYDLEGG